MQTVAQSFLVLRLTGSGTALGLATAARFVPIFVFGPIGGLVADRMDKRRVLYVTQTLSGLLAALFAVLIGPDVIEMWMVYLLALALGVVNVFDSPARQSFIAEMVRPEELSNAVTLNSVSLNLARVFGAALGGVFVAALGLAACFALNAVSFVAVLVSLAMMRGADLYPSRRSQRRRGRSGPGFRYVRPTPELMVPLVMIAVIGTLAWEFQVTLPLIARDTFHRGAGTYGLMASVMGGGAVIGGLIAASKKTRGPGPCRWPPSGGAWPSGGGAGPDVDVGTGRPGIRRLWQHHVQLHGQNDIAVGGHPDHAGPGDGSVGVGLVGIDPDRRSHRRLGWPDRRRPLVPTHWRSAHGTDRAHGLAGAHPNRPASGVQFIPRMRAGRQGGPALPPFRSAECFRPTALPVGGVEDRTRSRGV